MKDLEKPAKSDTMTELTNLGTTKSINVSHIRDLELFVWGLSILLMSELQTRQKSITLWNCPKDAQNFMIF